jgi:putative ABC transport system permease protein
MAILMNDVRYGVRSLLQRPGFTLVAVVALGLAIGATSAMFSVVNSVILKPLHFDDSNNVTIVWESAPKLNFSTFTVSPANFVDWHAQAKSFETMAVYSRTQFTLTGQEAAERIPGAQVSADYFKLVKTPPLIGRTFSPDETQPGKDKVVVVSYGFWNRRMGAKASAVGSALMLNGEPYTVVGVMPQRFMYPSNSEIWAPIDVNISQGRGGHYLVALGRLRPGVAVETADAEMKKIAADLAKTYPPTNDGWTALVVNLQDDIVGDIRQSLYILLAAVGFVLLIACANVANLLLARGADRAKEMAVRTAIGASRGRIVRQLLTESVILSLLGGVLGIGLAYAALSAFVSMAPATLPRIQETTLDLTVLLFTIIVALTTGVGFGLFPAFQVTRTNLHDALKESSRGSSSGAERHRVRNLLVAGEVALTIVVLIGAGLLMQSLGKLIGVNPGFNPQNVLTAQFNLPRVTYATDEAQFSFMNRMLERFAALPGVTRLGTISTLPLSGGSMMISYDIGGRAPRPPQEQPSGHIRFISPEYFETIQAPIVKGRNFTAQDRANSPRVVIINESLARREFPNGDPLGKQMIIGYGDNTKPQQTPVIVGVVRDMRIISVGGEVEPQYYLPVTQIPFSSVALALRTAGSPTQVSAALREAMKDLDPSIALYGVRAFEDVVAMSMAQTRFNATLLGTFAAVALLLASVGVYGVMAYSVNQRRHEIGIRLALGQTRSSILSMILRQGLQLAAAGAVIGIAGALALTRFLKTMLFNVNPTDLMTYAAVVAVLAAVAAGASLVPARRATRVDPVIALRSE